MLWCNVISKLPLRGTIHNYWSHGNVSDSFGRTCSKWQHSVEVLSFDIDEVLQAPEPTEKMPSGVLLWGLFSPLKSSLWRGLGHEKTFSQLVCLSRQERARRRMVQGTGLWGGWGKTWIFLSSKILIKLRPLFCNVCHCRGEGARSGWWWLDTGCWSPGRLLAKLFLHNVALWWCCQQAKHQLPHGTGISYYAFI